MTEVSVGRAESFADPGRKVVEIGGIEIGVFKFQGDFTAFENICPHLGGPACQGLMLPRTVDDVAQDNVNLARSFSKTQHNVICPWHGMEFDISTGEHVTTKTAAPAQGRGAPRRRRGVRHRAGPQTPAHPRLLHRRAPAPGAGSERGGGEGVAPLQATSRHIRPSR